MDHNKRALLLGWAVSRRVGVSGLRLPPGEEGAALKKLTFRLCMKCGGVYNGPCFPYRGGSLRVVGPYVVANLGRNIYEFVRNNATDARNPFTSLTSTGQLVKERNLRFNNFGGTLGGP